jgi:PilZ domain
LWAEPQYEDEYNKKWNERDVGLGFFSHAIPRYRGSRQYQKFSDLGHFVILHDRWFAPTLACIKKWAVGIVADRRMASRRRVLIGGVIVFSEMEPRIQCKVRDISEMGAGVEISADVNLPEEFDLVAEGIRRRCRMVWRSDTRVGVAFR